MHHIEFIENVLFWEYFNSGEQQMCIYTFKVQDTSHSLTMKQLIYTKKMENGA